MGRDGDGPRRRASRRTASARLITSGRAKVVIEGTEEIDLTPGDFFHIATEFDSWVVGHRPCEVLYVNGVEQLISRLHR